MTGVNYFLTEIIAKRFGVLRELVPAARRIYALINPGTVIAHTMKREATEAASVLGVPIEFAFARNSDEIDDSFATMARNKADALFVAPDTFLANRSMQIITLASRYGLPAIYPVREEVELGGLVSYGPSRSEAYAQLGTYAARILKGAKPADLPVVQTTKFELVINLTTAKVLGLKVPASLLARADEVIE
jgi:putative ABC transport system substrate-binding protein